MSVILKRKRVNPNRIFFKDRKTNCYILGIEDGVAYIIDPGGQAKKIIKIVKTLNAVPIAIILTHGHLDHWYAMDELIKEYDDIQLWMNESDYHCFNYYYNFCKNIRNSAIEEENKILERAMERVLERIGEIKNKKIDWCLKEGDTIQLGDIKLKILLTNGHSYGSISLYTYDPIIYKRHKYRDILISGDFVIEDGLGRTDLDGSNEELLYTNIEQKLLSNHEFSNDTLIFPGHKNVITIRKLKKVLFRKMCTKDVLPLNRNWEKLICYFRKIIKNSFS